MNKIPVIAIVGPTASGKTKVSIDLAKKLNAEIISADSMQIYKTMDIASAKPTTYEMDGVKHHLIDFLNINENFSVVDYVTLAHETIKDVYERGKLPIVVGGTGLYVNSLLDDIDFSSAYSSEELRKSLYAFAKENGNIALWNRLNEIDKNAASLLHPNNVIRVARAIEIFELTGKSILEHKEYSRKNETRYKSLKLGLCYKDRNVLYDRINKRVDIMVEQGLLKEAEEYLNSNLSSTSYQAIGYKELKPYFNGEISLDEALDNLKKSTRHYAKRQLTWFNKDKSIEWYFADEYKNFLDLEKKMLNSIEKFL